MNTTIQPDDRIQDVASRYIKVLLWPVLAAGFFEISGSYQQNATGLLVFTNIALILVVVWKCSHERANWQTASVAGAACGAASTFMLALYNLMMDFHVVRIFNLMTQPIFTGILVAIGTGFLYSMLQLANAQRSHKQHTRKRG